MTARPRCALVMGGARSGKSEIAERLIAAWADHSPITYVATALLEANDPALAERVARHEARRLASPAIWTVVDAGADLAVTLAACTGPVLLDSLGPWVATYAESTAAFDDALSAVVEAIARRHGDTVVVSDEVGMSIHAPSEIGRWFVDAVGTANAAIARVTDPVWLCVAGRIVPTLDPEVALRSAIGAEPAGETP